MIDCRNSGITLTYIFSGGYVFTLSLQQLLEDDALRKAIAFLSEIHGVPAVIDSPLQQYSKSHGVGAT
jgi:hypothetical protein